MKLFEGLEHGEIPSAASSAMAIASLIPDEEAKKQRQQRRKVGLG